MKKFRELIRVSEFWAVSKNQISLKNVSFQFERAESTKFLGTLDSSTKKKALLTYHGYRREDSKLYPMGQIMHVACFCKAPEIRIVFTYLNG